MSAVREPEQIPVTLLTGFLGSGKTTLLNQLVRQPELADALVIVNEFGEMALDHLLMVHSREQTVLELGGGCLCCNVRTDLVEVLRDAPWRFARQGRRQFRRVVIETTGLADPVPIVHTLLGHPDVAGRYVLDGVVTTVDLATAQASLDGHEEAVRQVAIADVLLLTKDDLVEDAARAALEQRLRRLNPAAPRHRVRHGQVPAAALLGLGLFSVQGKQPDVVAWLNEEAYLPLPAAPAFAFQLGMRQLDAQAAAPDPNRHDDHVQAFCFRIEEPIAEQVLGLWLDTLVGVLGPALLRIKGIVHVQGQAEPLVVHAVQQLFHPAQALPAWPDDDRGSRLVFITRDVEPALITQTFEAFRTSAALRPVSSSAWPPQALGPA
ncbi:CobW family GTP-binding protein [Pseudoxanthomonas winnipegensis]|uniref:CobW family GTP-binding protein n=1 Tax=Pseudoxanthomonas winnipegensis TaxID=2480810 RepID=UPI001040CBD0|nr:GTP-binding protein [Pseudoxanthomonas winnipegensis]TBV72020.1 GTP-binding protein [Pseudoxanthomonas winnipegensis]